MRRTLPGAESAVEVEGETGYDMGEVRRACCLQVVIVVGVVN